MSESGLYPVQTWLWSELDDLGIDGVIYSRHILDLLISSKHTMDYRLAEKEQDIFSKIAPGGKKRKHKYSRRSSSFSACEEILLKKEIAVDCLLSAVDATPNSRDTANTIQQVVDELYVKLAGLHLISDAKKANSDDDYTTSDRSIEATRPRKKENYEDAFPSLDRSNSSPVASLSASDSIWHKSSRGYESKSECDSDNISGQPIKPNDDKNSSLNEDKTTTDKDRSFETRPVQSDGSDDSDHLDVKQEKSADLLSSQPSTKSNLLPRQSRSTKKLRPFRKSHPTWPFRDSSGCSQQKRPSRQRFGQSSRFYRANGGSEQTKYKNDSSKKYRSSRPVKSQYRHGSHSAPDALEKSIHHKKDEECKKTVKKFQNKRVPGKEVQPEFDQKGNEEEYAHLPSWMETTLTDFSNPCIWFNNNDTGGLVTYDSGSDVQSTMPEGQQEMAFSSKWYRDPETGFLTFQPSKTSNDHLSTSSNSTGRRSSSSSEVEDELCQKISQSGGKLEPTAAESWMWCPSPSLWEDGQTSPISRLHSVYKREIFAFNNAEEEYVDDISGRIWEEYKTIFLDLQDMEENTNSDRRVSLDFFEKLDNEAGNMQTAEKVKNNVLGILPVQPGPDGCLVQKAECALEEKCLVTASPSPPDSHLISTSAVAGSSSSAVQALSSPASSSLLNTDNASEKTAGVTGGSFTNEVWRYPPVSDGWSSGDDIRRSMEDMTKGRNEVSNALESDTCGQSSDDSPWKETMFQLGPEPAKQHEVWGGGDMSALGKPATSSSDLIDEDEKMMNYIVDAMFSDLEYMPVSEHSSTDCFGVLPERRIGTQPLPSSYSWSGQQGLRDILNVDCDYRLFSVDIRSLCLHSSVPNFQSYSSCNPWQPKWKMDELITHARPLTSVPNLDNFLASIATADHSEIGPAPENWGPGPCERNETQKKTFLDSVTENDAWKTSLRIGNIWQNISGIRPVNVIYSENKQPRGQLLPSSDTHFRPISAPLGNESMGISETYTSPDPYTALETSDNSTTEQKPTEIINTDMEEVNEKSQYEGFSKEPSFQMNFSKLVQDKSMQTAFGIKVEHEISAACPELFPRLPKANSR